MNASGAQRAFFRCAATAADCSCPNRFYVVYRLPHLKFLDGMPISAEASQPAACVDMRSTDLCALLAGARAGKGAWPVLLGTATSAQGRQLRGRQLHCAPLR